MSSPHPKRSPAEPGAIQNRGLGRGEIVNLISRFRRRLEDEGGRLTVAQNRVIMKRIEAADLVGSKASSASRQLSQIAAIVAPMVPMDQAAVEAELRACRG